MIRTSNDNLFMSIQRSVNRELYILCRFDCGKLHLMKSFPEVRSSHGAGIHHVLDPSKREAEYYKRH